MFNRVSSQDVSASYASIGIVRVTFTAARQAASSSGAPTETPLANTDSVSLSPNALAAAQGVGPSTTGSTPSSITPSEGTPESATPPPSPTNSRADRLAAALIKALDTNQDGALSTEEFVDGAKALLGRGRIRRRGGEEDGGKSDDRVDSGHHHGRGHRLERRLEKAFGRIDADANGSLDAGELAAALARSADPKSGVPAPAAGTPNAPPPVGSGTTPAPVGNVPTTTDPTAPTAPDQQVTPAATQAPTSATATPTAPSTSNGSLFSFSVTTVTFVSVAVQKYQAVSELKA